MAQKNETVRKDHSANQDGRMDMTEWTKETGRELAGFYQGKKVLVTGHTGFKGGWLIRMLAGMGAEVTGYSLNPPTDPSLFTAAGLKETMNSVNGDIRNLSHLMEVFKKVQPEVVFHLAAQPIVRDSYKYPVYTYETNVMGTVHLLECLRQNSCVKSLVNVTTDKVYENKEWEYGYRECDVLSGFDPYSNSKSCSELVTQSYCRSFFADKRTAISTVRAGNVIGGGDFANDRIIPDCIRAVTEGREIVIRNPYSTRPFQHVLEPLAVYLAVAMKQYGDAEVQGSYNVGPADEDCITAGRLADLFVNAWGQGAFWVNRYDGGPHEAGFLKLDCSKVRKTFGWKPRYTVKEAVEKTVEWTKAYLAGEAALSVTDRQIHEFFH